MVTQALWNKDSYLKQLPHFTGRNCQTMPRARRRDRIRHHGTRRRRPKQAPPNDRQSDGRRGEILQPVSPTLSSRTRSRVRTTFGAAQPVNIVVQLEREDEVVGPVIAPMFPQKREEGWWVVIGESKSNSLISIKRLSLQQKAKVKLDFVAPAPGDHTYTLTPNGSKQAQTRNTGAVHVRISRIGSDMNVPADRSAAVATLILAGGLRRGAALPSRYAGSFIERHSKSTCRPRSCRRAITKAAMDAMYTAGAHMTKHLQENFDGYDRFFSWISFAADPPRNVLWYYPIALTFSNPLGVRILIAASCFRVPQRRHQVDPERAPSILVRQDEVRHRHPARPDAADLRNRAGFSFGTRHGHRGRPVRRDPLRHKLRLTTIPAVAGDVATSRRSCGPRTSCTFRPWARRGSSSGLTFPHQVMLGFRHRRRRRDTTSSATTLTGGASTSTPP
ncbi:hypothetical protein HPB51_017595 [Rhipicephalus microplus]|uniref:SEC63 domain-containing protein n=1 Tax=Rhipicephalus microplus TaxID=6941 RepID=A0A9J6E2F6_RHIMP|nr:hypothetical protein HPB51_017595 [Rhipicephalus microplus]